MLAPVDPQWVRTQLPPGDYSAPLGARFLVALADRIGAHIRASDAVLAARTHGQETGLDLREITGDAHPRVRLTHHYRDEVRAWQTSDGVGCLVLGRGLVGPPRYAWQRNDPSSPERTRRYERPQLGLTGRGQRGGRDRVRRRGQVQGFTPPAKPICRLADRGLDLEGDRQRMPPARDVKRERGAWRVAMANRCVSMYAYDGLARCYRWRGQRERTGQPKLISDAGERHARGHRLIVGSPAESPGWNEIQRPTSRVASTAGKPKNPVRAAALPLM